MSRRLLVRPAGRSALPGDDVAVVEDAPLDPADDQGDLLGTLRQDRDGVTIVEVVVDGWRFELAVEDEARAALRRRATRERDAGATSGPLEVRAIIPGRVAEVRVVPGDAVEAGAALLVVEAMKMQNELRAPRAGTVERLTVAAGDTIELGDVLLVIG